MSQTVSHSLASPPARFADRISAISRALTKQRPTPERVDVWSLPMVVHRPAAIPPAGREACLLVGYAPDGRPTPAALSLLDAFTREGVDCYVCLAVDDCAVPIDMSGLEGAAAVFGRQNGGYDFAVWAAVLASHPELWQASRLIFANDSIIGPFRGFADMMRRLRASNADFIALTESHDPVYHTQSYFFAFQNKALDNPAIRQFWSEVRVERDKNEVIRRYELPLIEWVRRLGRLQAEVLFPYGSLFQGANLSKPVPGNPTHHLWERLLLHDFPFVKAELLHRNPGHVWIRHWEPVLQAHGGDTNFVHAHLAEMDRTRGVPKSSDRSANLSRGQALLRLILGSRRFNAVRMWNRKRIRRRRMHRAQAAVSLEME